MKTRILFIGNSYTYFHDMPESIFLPMAKEAGLDAQVTAVTHGGYWLRWFADPENEEGKRLRSVIEGQHYDWVVLQDYSLATIQDPGAFFGGIRKLKQLLEPHTDKFVLYATWGRKPGCITLEEIGMTNPQMARRIAEQYDEAGIRFGMKVAHVGKAFLAHSEEKPEDELYFADLHHSSPLGSAVAARTILDVILAG